MPTLPSLEDVFDDSLIAQVDDILGDTIRYRVAGGTYASVKAYVEYGEALRDISTGRLIDQDNRVTIAKTLLPARPTAKDRIILRRSPDTEFKPINVEDAGDDWQLAVQRA
jgi:hypothetical protein